MLECASMSLARAVRRVAISPRYAILVLSLLTLLFASRSARAQLPTVTQIVGTVLRVPANPHPGGVADNIINYADCKADLSFRFTLGLSGVPNGDNLVVWAGPATTDCTALASRQPSTATCWPVVAGPLSQGNGETDAGLRTTTFEVRMQDIVAQAASAPGTITPTYPPGGWTDQENGVCTRQLTDAESPLFLWFFFTDSDNLPAGDAIGVAQAYPVVVDTYAQDLAGGVSVTQSLDSQLTVTISTPPDSTTASYNIYCDGHAPNSYDASTTSALPQYDAASNQQCVTDSSVTDSADSSESSTSSEDASTGSPEDSSAGSVDSSTDSAVVPPPPDDAGGSPCAIPLNEAGASTTGPAPCPPSFLQSGGGTASEVPTDDGGLTNEAGAAISEGTSTPVRGTMLLSIPPMYLCGTASPSSPSLTITGLHDGDIYTIAAAAVDVAGNIGPLALATSGSPNSAACTTVSEIPDFWANYVQAGGQAGGGYCSAAEGVGLPAGTTGLGLLMMASMVAVSRRRRRRG
jgi:hypothetical protein